MSGGKHALVIIDPQNDFCDQRGSLYVDGAAADMARLGAHVGRRADCYTDIFVTLDSHDVIAIFHPRFWCDGNGEPPAPYTTISPADYASGLWRTAAEENGPYAARFFDVCVRKNVASLMIWPEHCVVSTWGHQVADSLREGLRVWRERTGRAVRFCFKGENPYTEQFSAFEGVDDSWSETAFNEALFGRLAVCESVTFAGEALSHCVEASILSYTRRLGDSPQAVRVIADCTSPVTGFDRAASEARLSAAGVRFVRTDD